MVEVIIRYDPEGNSLDVWFGKPTDEFVSEEVRDGVILKMDKDGNVIGVEKLFLLPTEAWKSGEPVIVNTGAPLAEAQSKVREISEAHDKENVYSSAFFITLLNGQLGSVANKYLRPDGGRKAENIEKDITDIIVCSLAYLNWLGVDGSKTFATSLQAHRDKILDLKRSPRNPLLAKLYLAVEEIAEKKKVSPEVIDKVLEMFRKEMATPTE